jgi:hypothetical protein
MKQKPELRILRKMCSFHDIELKFLRKIQIWKIQFLEVLKMEIT